MGGAAPVQRLGPSGVGRGTFGHELSVLAGAQAGVAGDDAELLARLLADLGKQSDSPSGERIILCPTQGQT